MNDLETRVNRLLRVNLRDVASSLADAFYDHLRRRFSDDDDEPTLRNALCPQWVVLAGGRGSRIDRSGRLNKNLDIWFGAKNALQLAYEHLPGDRPPIIVANPDMIRRAMLPEYHNATWEDAGAVDDSMLDPAVRDFYFGENAVLAAQPVADGTGGALRAATDALQRSEAEWVGVAFGDEAFLDRRLFIETYISHVLADADATLCGKRPDAVVDKGGLFFDSEGRFTGTKEWYDMMPDEQQYLFDALGRGEAITNTGISLIRRKPMLERFSRLWLHKNGTEYHHVDFFHLFYQDGLKTHAHVYDGEIRSGINRWINVNEGESHRYEQVRAELSEAGVRVHPDASVSFESDAGTMLSEGRLGVGCVLSGRVHLGATVTLGSYSYLEDATLTGNTSIGTRTRVARSKLDDVVVD
ncbi:MAG: hypothetical protein O3A46_13090, partial [Candidatus Poribacteria bacterium]|nr:hypothetical protein [Candidatus Poribacteria bacterium]